MTENISDSITEIGFEDYFFLFELVHNKQKIENPDRFNSRGFMRRMFLDAVFNKGKIEIVHENFTDGFITWLKTHNHIFTTNYDSNLDIVTGVSIHHLHGAFNILSNTYNPTNLSNQLSDDLLDGEKVDYNYPHLYSTCLISYTGDIKSFSMAQPSLANSGMNKLIEGYQNKPELHRLIEEWDEKNTFLKRLKEAVILKMEKPELKIPEQYPHEKLKEISGTLEIVGLSPNNDGHLFKQILENDQLTEIIFNYFGQKEATDAKNLFASKNVVIRDVREFWADLNS